MIEGTCPECGAEKVDGKSCFEQLGELIAWEYNDPELLGEHFLTVASYNVQHPAQFTDVARETLRRGIAAYLDGASIAELRAAVADFDGPKRVLRPESERAIVPKKWSVTIADVYTPHEPKGAAERVRAWGKAVRTEM